MDKAAVEPKTPLVPNVRQAVPFFIVSNIEKSVGFYIDGLGFEMTTKWVPEGKLRWCWLQRGGGALMLQEFRDDGGHPWRPKGKVGEGVSIYFICDDALAIYREMKGRDLAPSRPFVGNGMWVTSLSDPDGYEIFFESPTDAPEETEFSEHPEQVP